MLCMWVKIIPNVHSICKIWSLDIHKNIVMLINVMGLQITRSIRPNLALYGIHF